MCRQGAVPISGPTRVALAIENINAASLSDEEMAEIQRTLDILPIWGKRSEIAHEKFVTA